ncbi:VOC family protein [Kribbella monticola]|uniref:VOC family protein n=1 Tax=Kribbella monticola TaxID=2185285 RepID=UPI000DD2FD37|nr:VOC family protein [Kribbella monticola]
MTTRLVTLCFDAQEPPRLAEFWAGILGRKVGDDGVTLLPNDELEFAIRFTATEAEKSEPNQMHFDLTSATPEAQQATVAKALDLGGQHLDIGQRPEDGHVVLADPEGNEFCVIEAGNNFLAGTGTIGAFSSDGSQAVGYFWSKALDWPLVWDQDEETAIQSPEGGSKISWGGPPVREKTAKNRLVFEVAPPAGGEVGTEVSRLVSLGATRVGPGESGAIEMLDPDGNEFRVLAAR